MLFDNMLNPAENMNDDDEWLIAMNIVALSDVHRGPN